MFRNQKQCSLNLLRAWRFPELETGAAASMSLRATSSRWDPQWVPSSTALKEKAAGVQPFTHSVVSFPVSVLSAPSTNQRVAACSEGNPVDLVASSELRTLGRLLPPGVLGSWEAQDGASWEGGKGLSTDSGVWQESSYTADLGFLGWTT